MPTVSIERDVLFKCIGCKEYTDEEFDELCFEFGIELDEVTSEQEEAAKSGKYSENSNILYKIDVPANRYDLLCLEGLSRALRIFLQLELQTPKFVVTTTEPVVTVHVKHVEGRPFVVCAVLRGLMFTEERYKSFMDLQDQLHRNLCRQRTLVAIGTHDLNTIQPPFTYQTKRDFEFVPLTHSKAVHAADLILNVYENDPSYKHLKPYLPIINQLSEYPVILDSNHTVLSLPPIINGSISKITLDTKDVFIECTATDLTKANIVLDTIVAMFSQYTSPHPFTVEPVHIFYHHGTHHITPLMSTRTETASVDFINSIIGAHIAPADMLSLCNKVQLGPAQLLDHNRLLQVTVPPTRSDILHPVDIAEDVAIAYGYSNIVKRNAPTLTVGAEQTLNLLSDLLRDEIARAGYTEVLTHALCSIHDNFTALRTNANRHLAVALSNPANVEYQVVRTSLLPGLLKSLQHNKSASFTNGFKLFEISDVVLKDDQHLVTDTVVGAKNLRRCCAVYAGPTSGFEIIHGLVDRIMLLSQVIPMEQYIKHSGGATDEEKYRIAHSNNLSYCIEELSSDHPLAGTYFPGRAANLLLKTSDNTTTISLGTFGVLHPEVLHNFDILYPASCLEIDLEPLL